jgi:hypothetical protein
MVSRPTVSACLACDGSILIDLASVSAPHPIMQAVQVERLYLCGLGRLQLERSIF